MSILPAALIFIIFSSTCFSQDGKLIDSPSNINLSIEEVDDNASLLTSQLSKFAKLSGDNRTDYFTRQLGRELEILPRNIRLAQAYKQLAGRMLVKGNTGGSQLQNEYAIKALEDTAACLESIIGLLVKLKHAPEDQLTRIEEIKRQCETLATEWRTSSAS